MKSLGNTGGTAAQSIPELFEQCVRRAPEAIAVESCGKSVTYRELHSRSDQVACALARVGIGQESVVAVCSRRSAGWVTAVLGVLKAGAAYLPLDPRYPAERIAYLVTDSGCELVLADAESRRAFLGLPVPTAGLAELDDGGDRPRPPRPAQSACIIYTSGSTGQPKGVSVPHTGFGSLAAQAGRIGFGPGSRVLQASSPGFGASVWDLCSSLLTGATLVLAAEEDLEPGPRMAETITTKAVSHATLTPAVVSAMHPDSVPSLRCLIVAGDTTTPELVAAWAVGRTMINAYGSSETTVCATMSEPLRPDGRTPDIGRAIVNAAVRVLDPNLHAVQPGTTGELYVSGPLLSRGYRGRPGQTAERFVADPSGVPGARMYRTGDLASWTADGQLVLHGRADHQIKIRGVRIEPQEVETALTAHPGVADAVVVAREAGGSKHLVAYVVPAAGAVRASGDVTLGPAFSLSELRAFAVRRLPAPLVPAAFVVLDRIPLNPNGKRDRAALPRPRIRSAEYRAPRDWAEETLAKHFADVLGVDRIGIDDDVFTVGLDSIRAIQVASRSRSEGVEISAREIFESRTVAALASGSGSRPPEAAAPVLSEFDNGGIGAFPLLPAVRQAREQGPASGHTCQAAVFRLPAAVGRTDLVSAVRTVLDRHEMLRMRLAPDEIVTGPPGSGEVLLERIRWDAPWDDAWRERVQLEVRKAAAALDPAKGMVARFVWFDANPGRLLVVLHRLVADDTSWRILESDLAAAWAAAREGTPARLSGPGTSLRRWAHALVGEAHRPARLAELPLWRSILAGPDPVLESRRLIPRLDVTGTVHEQSVTLSVEETEALLTRLPAALRSEMADGLLAGLALALAKRRSAKGSGDRSLLIRVERDGREQGPALGSDLARTVGRCVIAFPVRFDLSDVDLDDALAGGPAAGTAVRIVKQRLRSVPGGGLGYGLLRDLNQESAQVLSEYSPGQVSFAWRGRFDAAGAGPWGRVDLPELSLLETTQDPDLPVCSELSVDAVVADGPDGPRLRAVFAAPSGVLAPSEVDELVGLWLAALAALAQHAAGPDAGGLTPSDVPLSGAVQADLDRWQQDYPGLADVWPLTPLQSGFLFHSMARDSGLDAYQVQYVLHLVGDVDAERMRAAGQGLLTRHAGLRSAFAPERSGDLVQLIVGQAELPWRTADLRDVPDAGRDDAFERLLAEDLRTHFDPAVPPLLRMTLVRKEPGAAELVLTAHHALLDGWSVPLLVRDLLLLYSPGPVELPRARDQREFLAWRARQDKHEAAAAWKRELDGAGEPTIAVPADDGGQDRDGEGIEHVDVVLSAAESASLVASAAELGVTLNTVVQSAWGLMLAAFTGRRDVVFGAVVSGRPPAVPGVDEIVGMLLNTVPVRVDCGPAKSLAGLIREMHDRQAALLDHHHHGLSEIHKSTGSSALFDTIVGFESFPLDRTGITAAGEAAGISVTGIRSFITSHYPLGLMVFVDSDSFLRASVQYRRNALDAAAAAGAAALLSQILRQVSADPAVLVGAAGLGWLAAPDPEPRTVTPTTLPELLVSRAERTPDSVAVRCSGTRLTYRELDAQSAEAARELIRRGVTAETPVSVSLAPSAELVVALTAVLRSGACVAGPGVAADVELTAVPAGPGGGAVAGPRPGGLAAMFSATGYPDGPRTVLVSHASLAARLADGAPGTCVPVRLSGDFGQWLVALLAAVCVGGGAEIFADGGGTAAAELFHSEAGQFGGHVLDACLRPTPPGAVGELYATGPGLARGYAGPAGATATSFLPDPFGPAGARMFRTGDRVRRGRDGQLVPVGRTDRQVRVGGILVSPPAVEAVLLAHPEVDDAAVLAPSQDGAAGLIAYVVGAGLEGADLAGFVAARLPGPMVPSIFVAVEGIPRLPGGRLDEAALSAVETTGSREPRSEMEAALRRLFEEILDVEDIGLDDDFFEQGGTSLLATRMNSRIRRELGANSSIRTIFQHSSIAGLARALEEAGQAVVPGLRKMDRSQQP
ncbi:amino acid adenylation domain-containing protein [Amycolatopsis sp. VS8301801F10]|uniref:amino acid adenylation domain-containing protein n=1 Tax=Amycolatopsis sp. VS8301801F10 TaxID=2652442 RepID=UPI0038FC24F8